MTPARLLIVDDDAGQRSLLESFLRPQGFVTTTAASGEAALQLLAREPFDLVISDVRMPGMSGLETLRRARQTHPHLPVLLVTAFGDIRSAVEAMRDGAVNYLAKPIDLDELMASVRLALAPGAAPARPAPDLPPLPPDIIAASPLLRAVLRDAAVAAPADTRVLLSGESGTGKAVLAHLVHGWSQRAAGPFIRVDCAALPGDRPEAELFGHEKGAFPGASLRLPGRIGDAEGGTLFLAEVAALPPTAQAGLLRLINDGVVRRLGASRDTRCDVRVLAASARDLGAEVASGRFREDLFYRLNVLELHVPPLRERPEDVLPLATHFIGLFSRQKPRFSASVAAALGRYRWPGNVRELRNAMERAALLSRGEVVLPEHLPARVLTPDPAASAVVDTGRLEEIEREAILRTLRRNNYNRTETARELAISRRALTYKLQRLRAAGTVVDP
jgi:DNA-binding NtrC family response regulator